VIDANYKRSEKILQDNISILHNMAKALMKWETIDKTQIDALMAGKEPLPHPEFPTHDLAKADEAKIEADLVAA
jgi:cell division protease FtsH